MRRRRAFAFFSSMTVVAWLVGLVLLRDDKPSLETLGLGCLTVFMLSLILDALWTGELFLGMTLRVKRSEGLLFWLLFVLYCVVFSKVLFELVLNLGWGR